MRMARPDTLRRYHDRLRTESFHKRGNGVKPDQQTEQQKRAEGAGQLRQMMETPGWKFFLSALIDDELVATRAMADPLTDDKQAAILRRDIIGANYALRKLEYLVRIGDEALAYINEEKNHGRSERRE